MKPAEIVQAAGAEGVVVTLSPVGAIKASGEQTAVNRWRSILAEHKAAIVNHLMTETEGRKWLPGWPFTCACGDPTGWASGGEPRCPNCEFDHRHQGGVQ